MNDCCLREFAEYEGQYKEDIWGATEGCTCCDCRDIREQAWKRKEKPKKRKENNHDR